MDEQEISKFLKMWGLPPGIGKAVDGWSMTQNLYQYFNDWTTKYPDPPDLGIGIIGHDTRHPDLALWYLLSRLLSLDKIDGKAHIIKIGELIQKYGSFEEKNEMISQTRTHISRTELVVFADIGISQMSAESQNLVYSLVHSRMMADKPFILTLPGGQDGLQQMGTAFIALVKISCRLVGLN